MFTAFAGETWDYMGSKRFLWELHSGSSATAGLSLDHIDQVLCRYRQLSVMLCYEIERPPHHAFMLHFPSLMTSPTRPSSHVYARSCCLRLHLPVTYSRMVFAWERWQVIELGQVGRARGASGQAAAEFFVHSQRGPAFGDAAPLRSAIAAAAAAMTTVKVLISFQRLHCIWRALSRFSMVAMQLKSAEQSGWYCPCKGILCSELQKAHLNGASSQMTLCYDTVLITSMCAAASAGTCGAGVRVQPRHPAELPHVAAARHARHQRRRARGLRLRLLEQVRRLLSRHSTLICALMLNLATALRLSAAERSGNSSRARNHPSLYVVG